MENLLPEIIEFNGTGVKEGDFKVALNKLLLYLAEAIGPDGGNLFPKGFIGLWSGAINKIPAGWALCNGENGTPDLRDKFVVCAGENYEVGATGGATSAAVSGNTGATTLSVAQIPSHNHNVEVIGTDDSGGDAGARLTYRTKGYISNIGTGFSGGSQAHSHSLSGIVGTLPPFYALCFIMKL